MVVNPLSVATVGPQGWLLIANRGKVLVEADENEAILFAEVGECGRLLSCRRALIATDVEMLATTRSNLPVTVQRRFDVYTDVAQS